MDIYDEWNIVKKRIEYSNHKPPYFKEGDIWWLSVGYNIGNEVYGKGRDFVRPVLIVKKFNAYSFVGIPLSTKIKKNPYYEVVTVKGKRVAVMFFQIRTFSSKRLSNKLGVLELNEYSRIVKKVKEIFKLPPSITRGSRG